MKWRIWSLTATETFTWSITAYFWDVFLPAIFHWELHHTQNEGGKVGSLVSLWLFFLLQISRASNLIFHHHGWHEGESPSQLCSIQHHWKTVPVSCNTKCDLETNHRNKLWSRLPYAQGKNFVRPLGCFFQPRELGSSAKKTSPNVEEFTHLKNLMLFWSWDLEMGPEGWFQHHIPK